MFSVSVKTQMYMYGNRSQIWDVLNMPKTSQSEKLFRDKTTISKAAWDIILVAV